jgi:hypothetical protein
MCMVILRTSREAARRLPSALLSRRQQPRLSASSASAWRADQPVHWRLRGTGRQRLYCTESELFYDWADPSQQPQRNAPAWRRMERVRPPAAGPRPPRGAAARGGVRRPGPIQLYGCIYVMCCQDDKRRSVPHSAGYMYVIMPETCTLVCGRRLPVKRLG